jgi:hypothetical protein
MIPPRLDLGADDIANVVSSHTQSGPLPNLRPKVTRNALLSDVSYKQRLKRTPAGAVAISTHGFAVVTGSSP